MFFQSRDQLSHQLVHEGDLAVVEALPVATMPASVGLGRGVGCMGIEEVDEGEKGPRRLLLDPIECRSEHFVPGSLARLKRCPLPSRGIEVVEVRVETLSHAPPLVKHEGSDEAPGGEAVSAEDLGQRHFFFPESIAEVVDDAVPKRGFTGEDRSVRGKRQGGDRGGILEEYSFARQPLDMWSADFLIAIRRKVVGA